MYNKVGIYDKNSHLFKQVTWEIWAIFIVFYHSSYEDCFVMLGCN